MTFEAKNFEHLLGLQGLSEKLLKNHFKLYQGYVTNTNKLLELMKSEEDPIKLSELKRRFAWEFNGMRLHELFFNNLTQNLIFLTNESKLLEKIKSSFWSFENFQEEFKKVAMMRGIGWVVLYYDKTIDKLIISWINEHDVGHLTGLKPLLILDMFEHAFLTDYDLNKAEYIDNFFKIIDWEIVEKRFLDA